MIRRYLITHSEKFISKWLILLLDVVVTLVTVPIVFFVIHNLRSDQISLKDLFYFCSAAFVVYTFGYLLVGSYKGIIRHTSSFDALKITGSGLLGLSLMFAVNTIFDSFNIFHFRLPYALIILHFLLTVFTLIVLRFFIKVAYSKLTRDTIYENFVLIYGASSKGIITKNALAKDKHSRSKVVAFVDDDATKAGKTMEGIPIFSLANLDNSLFERLRVNTAIIAIDNISRSKINDFVDICLQSNISVKQIPPLKDWIQGKINSSQIKKVNIEDLLQRSQLDLTNKHIRKHLAGKVVMVTGAAGSIGSEITMQVLLNGAKRVLLLDKAETPMHDLIAHLRTKGFLNGSLKDYIIDILQEKRLRHIFETEKPDIVFHAAANKHVPLMEDHPHEAFDVNVCGTRIVANMSGEFGVEKFVFVSTDKAVRPTSVMGATKRLAEIYIQSLNNAQKYDTKYIITRFGNVLGSNGSVIPTFKRQIENGGPLTITHAEVTRYFMTIPEACHLVLEAGVMGNGGEVFIFDMGKPVKVIDLAKKMIALSGFIPYEDIDIKVVGLRPGEKLYEELWIGNETKLATHHEQIMIASAEASNLVDVEKTIASISNEIECNLVNFDKSMIIKSIGCFKREETLVNS